MKLSWKSFYIIDIMVIFSVYWYRELGSNYLLISRDFKNCIVIRAIYFKVFALANR